MIYLDHAEKNGMLTCVHNTYFEYLGDTGIVGFSVTLMMIFYPIYIAIKKMRQGQTSWMFVLIHYTAFAIASLTEVPFIRNNWTSVFLIFGIVFFVWLNHDDIVSDEKKVFGA